MRPDQITDYVYAVTRVVLRPSAATYLRLGVAAGRLDESIPDARRAQEAAITYLKDPNDREAIEALKRSQDPFCRTPAAWEVRQPCLI